MFHFQFQLLTHQIDPYCHSMYPRNGLNRIIGTKKSVFKFLLLVVVVVVVVVQFRQAYLKNHLRYGDETLHKYWNP